MDISRLYSSFLANRIVSTDTRHITPGCIFFALKGENFDGNFFAKQAIDQGAALAVVSDPTLSGTAFIYAPDTLIALQALATHHREQLKIPVIGITGTNGKTTTKELVSAVLSAKYRIHATKGNLNNHIGVPLTILSVPDLTEILVCEMGANHIGEIGALCKIAQPTHGLITNIGRAHLEGFGSYEGVIQAKGELFTYLDSHHGFGFINTDDPAVEKLGHPIEQKTSYALKPESQASVHFQLENMADQIGFSIRDMHGSTRIFSPLFGTYNATNVLAAYCVGRHFHVDEGVILNAIGTFRSGSNRSEIIQWNGCTVVKDAYNANPSSMEVAIKAFKEKFPNGILVLGDMKELGQDSLSAHQQILRQITNGDFKEIFLVGDEFKKAADSMLLHIGNIQFAKNIEELRSNWNWERHQNQAILLKASRSMRLEYLVS